MSIKTSKGMNIQTSKGLGTKTSKGVNVSTSKGLGIQTSKGMNVKNTHDYAKINEYERIRDYLKWDTVGSRPRKEKKPPPPKVDNSKKEEKPPEIEPPKESEPVQEVVVVEEKKQEEIMDVEDDVDGKGEKTPVQPTPVLSPVLKTPKPTRLLSPLPSALGSVRRMLTMFSQDSIETERPNLIQVPSEPEPEPSEYYRNYAN